MVDDLIYTGAQHVPEARAVRDGRLVTGRFPFDLPKFCPLVLEAFAEVEGRPVPGWLRRTPAGQNLRHRDGRCHQRHAGLLQPVPHPGGRRHGAAVGPPGRGYGPAGQSAWEWGDFGGHTAVVDKALEDTGAVDSHDFPYEEKLRAVKASQLDGLVVPGGLGTWMVRGHPGLKKLIQEMDAAQKPISAIERGPKILLSAGILPDRSVTCSGEMRDDLIAAGIDYQDEPIVRDGNLLTCQGTEDLPAWGRAWMELY